VGRLHDALRDLSLNAKITLTLTVVFTATVGAFLAFLIPFLREQRESLLDKDKRVLSTLRDSYERGLIYDLISENSEALAVRLADLAAQRGLLWARVEAGKMDLAATADRTTIFGLVGEEARPFEHEPNLVLLLQPDGRGSLVTTGGRPLLSKAVPPTALPTWKRGGAGPAFEDVVWNGRPALYFTT